MRMKQVVLALLMFFGTCTVVVATTPAKLVLAKEQSTAPIGSIGCGGIANFDLYGGPAWSFQTMPVVPQSLMATCILENPLEVEPQDRP